MSDLATKMIESCETKEKPHNLDKNQIMSYLSLLEKIYNKENCDKFHQERIFRITKALNSIKKYSNFKVSPFRLSKSSIPKEEQKVLNETENNTIKENEDEQKDIEDIMCMIEKELKLNGIDINNIENDSFISTNVKSQNSNSVPDTQSKDSPLQSTQNKNTQKRLSKLFLKIEMKLKTYLQSEQENDSKPKLVSKEDQKCDNINNNELNNKSNVDKDNKINMSKRPSQLPELENSFFSNEKKVEMMLARAKKWKRKSMVEFKALQFSKLKNDCDIGIIYVKDDKNNDVPRHKAMPCTALLKKPKKKKNPKNTNDKIVSAFSYAKIDEKDEDMIENDEEINFDKINENQNEEEEKVDEEFELEKKEYDNEIIKKEKDNKNYDEKIGEWENHLKELKINNEELMETYIFNTLKLNQMNQLLTDNENKISIKEKIVKEKRLINDRLEQLRYVLEYQIKNLIMEKTPIEEQIKNFEALHADFYKRFNLLYVELLNIGDLIENNQRCIDSRI